MRGNKRNVPKARGSGDSYHRHDLLHERRRWDKTVFRDNDGVWYRKVPLSFDHLKIFNDVIYPPSNRSS